MDGRGLFLGQFEITGDVAAGDDERVPGGDGKCVGERHRLSVRLEDALRG
jgi:hypothetical protein